VVVFIVYTDYYNTTLSFLITEMHMLINNHTFCRST